MNLNYFLEFLKINFLMWPKIKLKLRKNQVSPTYRRIWWVGWEKGANQTKNFTGVKTENDVYYRGEK